MINIGLCHYFFNNDLSFCNVFHFFNAGGKEGFFSLVVT